MNSTIRTSLNLEHALRSAESVEDYFRQKENRREFTAIMFADLSRSTEYKARRRWFTGLLKVLTHNQVVSDTIQSYRGAVVKHLGDGVMSRFDGESSVIATNIISAAIAINEDFYERNRGVEDELEQYHTKIGISLGVVADLFESDPYGPCVDLAARLQTLAKPDQIIASAPVIEAADMTRITSVFGNAMGWTPSDYVLETKELRIRGFNSPQQIAIIAWGLTEVHVKPQEPGIVPPGPKFAPPTPPLRIGADFQERINALSPMTKELIFRLRSRGGASTVSRLEQKLAIPKVTLLNMAEELHSRGLGGFERDLEEIYLEPALSQWLDELFRKNL